MMIKDFKKNNCQLIMLQPNPDILTSLQSLSDKQMLIAKNEIDLIAILGESKSVTQDDMIVFKMDERASTWL